MAKKLGIPPVTKEDLVQSTKTELLSVFTPDATINFLLRQFTTWDLINVQSVIKQEILHERLRRVKE